MTEVQQIFFKNRCSLWKPVDIQVDPLTKLVIDAEYPSDPTYSNVPCCLHRKGEYSQPTMAGRYNRDLVGMTFDVCDFLVDQPTGDGWMFMLEDDGDLQEKEIWVITGDPAVRPDFMDGLGLSYSQVALKHALRAPGMTIPT